MIHLMDPSSNARERDRPPGDEKADARPGCCGDGGGFADNNLKSSKYTFANPLSVHFFIYKNLFEQFHRMANCYFLVVSAIMQVPGVSPLGRFTILATLIFVLLVSMFKAVWEDCKRHADDELKRRLPTEVLRDGAWVTVAWKDIVTGDVVRVAMGQGEKPTNEQREAEEEYGVPLPCDLVLIATPDPQGLVYIATMDLDGETNLKPRNVPKEMMKLPFAASVMAAAGLEGSPMGSPSFAAARNAGAVYRHALDVRNATAVLKGGRLSCESPNKRLGEFDGRMLPPAAAGGWAPGGDDPSHSEHVRLDNSNFLPRGAKLRQVAECVGIAVYCGRDTRLGKNMTIAGAKQSMMEHLSNIRLMFIAGLQLLLCLISTVQVASWWLEYEGEAWYLHKTEYDSKRVALSFLTFFVLYGNLIPISLYVSMEIAKVFQGFFIRMDLALYDEEKDMACKVKTTDINEDLGQVAHVFSDKTGTLTQNIMQFFKFAVDGNVYGQGQTAISAEIAKKDGGDGMGESKSISGVDLRPDYVKACKKWPFYDPEIQDRGNDATEAAPGRLPMWGPPKGSFPDRSNSPGYGFRQYRELRRFWEVLAVCHTVLPKRGGARRDKDGKPGQMVGTLESEQPDEKAFVAAAGELGVAMVRGDVASTTLAIDAAVAEDSELGGTSPAEVEEVWEILERLAFDSKRKRSSVIVREPERRTGAGKHKAGSGLSQPGARQIWCFTKGADSAVQPQLTCVADGGAAWREGAALPDTVRQFLGEPGPADRTAFVERYSYMHRDLYQPWVAARRECHASTPDRNDYVEQVLAPLGAALRQLAARESADGGPLWRRWPADLVRLKEEWEQAGPAAEWDGVAWDVAQRYQTHWLVHEKSDAAPGRGGGRSLPQVTQALADEALRTLYIARRRIPPRYWEAADGTGWFDRWQKAAELDEGERKKRQDELTDEMESCLELCGLTAIEDKLQERVPEVIESLRQAGINVWMITGDKPNTAENIALACRLFDAALQRELIRFEETDAHHLEVTLVQQGKAVKTVAAAAEPADLPGYPLVKEAVAEARRKRDGGIEYAVLVNSACLRHVWGEGPTESSTGFCDRWCSAVMGRDKKVDDPTNRCEEMVMMLYEVLNFAKAVVIARATPDQKRQMVRLIKDRNPWTVTLAIGDGANDVAMIQAASVGVGIQGEEGGQAAAQADFAFGKFKFLQRLLYVHGRWNYRRMATFTNYFFYKNAVLSFTLFFYNCYTAYSGQPLYDQWVMTAFNIFWASWPIIIYAIFDRDILNTDNLTDFPKLYQHTRCNNDFTALRSLQWYGEALFHSLMCLFIPLAAYSIGDYMHEDFEGRDYGLYHMGVLVYTNVVTVITLKLMFHIKSYTWVMYFALAICYASWPAFLPVYADTGLAESLFELYWMRNSWWDSVSWDMFWLLFFLVIVVCLIRDVVWQYCSYHVMPLLPPDELEAALRAEPSPSDRTFCQDWHRLCGITRPVSLHKVVQLMDRRIGRQWCCAQASYMPPWEMHPHARPRYGEQPLDADFAALQRAKGYGGYCSKGEWLCCCDEKCSIVTDESWEAQKGDRGPAA